MKVDPKKIRGLIFLRKSQKSPSTIFENIASETQEIIFDRDRNNRFFDLIFSHTNYDEMFHSK